MTEKCFRIAIVAIAAMFLLMLFPASVFAGRYGYVPQTAEGVYYAVQGDQLHMLMADNIGLINSTARMRRYYDIRNLAEDMIWDAARGAYGIRRGGNFYPVMNQSGQFLTKRQRIERGAGIAALGAGIGWMAGGGKGAAIGAIIGGAGAVLNDSRYRSQRESEAVVMTVDPVPSYDRYDRGETRGQEERVIRSESRHPVPDGQALIPRRQVVYPVSSVKAEVPLIGYIIRNTTKVWMVVEVDGRPVKYLGPAGENSSETIVELEFGEHVVRGVIVVPYDNKGSGIDRMEIDGHLLPDGSGWVF